jgi:hypothetical protein
LPEYRTGGVPVTRQDHARRGGAGRCQPRRHAGHGEPSRDPLDRRRHGRIEGSFLAARGERYYVYRAKWSPDPQYFVYSMVSSGGHSPWQFPTMVYGRKQDRIVGLSDMINGNPTVSGEFKFTGPQTLLASTWRQPGSPDDKVPITVDLEAAFQKLKPSAD